MKFDRVALLLLGTVAFGGAGCGGKQMVSGTASFVIGGTSGSTSPIELQDELKGELGARATLTAGDGYIVSPTKAKVTFASVDFMDANNSTLGSTTFSNCTVTYDRSLASGASLLDCPFTVPVGNIYQIKLYYNTTLQILVSDSTVGIYSDPSSTTGFSTNPPSGGAAFVPYTVTIGSGSTRGTPIVFQSPITVAAGATPKLYVTVDMIHTFQLKVNSGGTTLSPDGSNDPVAVFGGLSPGSSTYYSGATTVGAYKVQGVPTLRIFRDSSGNPLYVMIGSEFCGADGGPKGAFASPPIGATIGGWLGEDSSKNVSWALPTDNSYATYDAYYTMADQTTIGQSTTLKCKATASPPAPTDGKTYASGAPAMASPDKTTTLTLLTK